MVSIDFVGYIPLLDKSVIFFPLNLDCENQKIYHSDRINFSI